MTVNDAQQAFHWWYVSVIVPIGGAFLWIYGKVEKGTQLALDTQGGALTDMRTDVAAMRRNIDELEERVSSLLKTLEAAHVAIATLKERCRNAGIDVRDI